MKNELSITNLISPDEFKIPSGMASGIASEFNQVAVQVSGLIQRTKDFLDNLGDGDPTKEQEIEARNIRLDWVKVRGSKGVDKIHKEQKSFFLNGGRYVDEIKKSLTSICNDNESSLESIELFTENKIREREVANFETRSKILSVYLPYSEDPSLLNQIKGLSSIDDELFDGLLSSVVTKHKALVLEKAKDQAAIERLYLYRPLYIFDKDVKSEEEIRGMSNDDFNSLIDRLKVESTQALAAKEELEKELERNRRREYATLLQERWLKVCNFDLDENGVKIDRSFDDFLNVVDSRSNFVSQAENKSRETTPQEKYESYIRNLQLPSFNGSDHRVLDVQSKFEGFKSWALKLQ
jgi:hypothetical protein